MAYDTPAGLAWLASNKTWIPADHLILINLRLMDLAFGRISRLAVFMPPRHGKSELISKNFPAWYLGRFPTHQYIATSFDAGLAAYWGGECRNILQEWGPAVFGVQVNAKSRASNWWTIDRYGGMMRTSGTGTSITGRGANVLGIDDPVKDYEQAMSKRYRDRAWEWYRSTAYTRLEPGGGIILIQTRWHVDDLAGRILNDREANEPWVILELPALATKDEVIEYGGETIWSRKTGDALWPQRYDVEALEQRRRVVKDFWFSALFQQVPIPAGGVVIHREWFENNRYRLDDRQMRNRTIARFLSFDTASKDGEENDWTVCMVLDLTNDYRLLVRYVERHRYQFPDIPLFVDAMIRRWSMPFPNGSDLLRAAIIEDKGTGTSAYQTLRMSLESAFADRLVAWQPQGSKVFRAQQAAYYCMKGCVLLPYPMWEVQNDSGIYVPTSREDAAWLYDLEAELFNFPATEHDDQVDTFSQGIIYLEAYLADGLRAREEVYSHDNAESHFAYPQAG